MRKAKNILDKFNFYYSILKYKLILYLILNIIVTLLDGLGLALFIPLISNLSTTAETKIEVHEKLNNILSSVQSFFQSPPLITILIIIISVFLIKGFFKALQVNYLAKLRFISLSVLRLNLLEKYESLSYEGYHRIDNGKIYNTITTEVGKIFNNLTNFIATIQNFIIVLTYLSLIILISPKFAFISVVLLIITNLFFDKVVRKTKITSEHITDESNKLFNFLFQTNFNFKYLKSTNKLPYFIQKLSSLVKKIEKLNYKMGRELSIIEGLKEPIAILIISAIIFIQIQLFKERIDSILISLLLLYRAIIYLNALKSGWQSFNQTFGSIEAVKNLDIALEQYKEQYTNGRNIEEIASIKLVNLHISYFNKLVLKNINFEIKKNQTIAIVGESGAGKTTIVNSILGLTTPQIGSILINNIPIQDLDIRSIRNRIGYITQDPAIFNDTLYNNVTFYSPRTEENLTLFWAVIKIAALKEFVESAHQQENTIIGINGTTISGGQKQRIAIARELFKKVDLLIMDEATSSLNYELENAIKENITLLKGKITIIIIAHRLNTIKNSDCIYVIQNKTVEGRGTYEELLKTSDNFKNMVQAQTTQTF